MKFKIKANDGKIDEVINKIKAFYKQRDAEVEFMERLTNTNAPKLYLDERYSEHDWQRTIIYLDTKEISKKSIYDNGDSYSEETVGFDKEELKFFDSLDFEIEEFSASMTDQDITDWF